MGFKSGQKSPLCFFLSLKTEQVLLVSKISVNWGLLYVLLRDCECNTRFTII